MYVRYQISEGERPGNIMCLYMASYRVSNHIWPCAMEKCTHVFTEHFLELLPNDVNVYIWHRLLTDW